MKIFIISKVTGWQAETLRLNIAGFECLMMYQNDLFMSNWCTIGFQKLQYIKVWYCFEEGLSVNKVFGLENVGLYINWRVSVFVVYVCSSYFLFVSFWVLLKTSRLCSENNQMYVTFMYWAHYRDIDVLGKTKVPCQLSKWKKWIGTGLPTVLHFLIFPVFFKLVINFLNFMKFVLIFLYFLCLEFFVCLIYIV